MFLNLAWLLLYVTWVGSEVAILLATRRRPTGSTDHDRGSLRILWPVIVGSIFLASWFGATHAAFRLPDPHQVELASIALFVIGLAIRWSAIRSLGRAFTVKVEINATQTLHRSGIFRLVRHPSYAGLLLVFAAIGLHTGNWMSVLILLLPTGAALAYRIHIEEQALLKAFGTEYADYRTQTKRLIPGIY